MKATTSLGAASPRASSCLPLDNTLLVPCSSFLQQYTPTTRIHSVNNHSQVINTIHQLRNAQIIVTSQENLNIYTPSLELKTTLPISGISSGSTANLENIFLGTILRDNHDNEIVVVSVENEVAIERYISGDGRLFHACFIGEGTRFVCVEQMRQSELVQVRKGEMEVTWVKVVVYDAKDGEVVVERVLEGVEYVYQVKTDGNMVALSVKGCLVCLDGFSLEEKWRIVLPGSGFLNSWIFTGGVVVAKVAGRLSWYKEGILMRSEPCGDIGTVTFIGWDVPDESLWAVTPDSIHHLNLKSEVSNTINYHSMVCVGIQFNPTGTLIACGDFGGKVSIWNTSENEVLRVIQLGFSAIRSLNWSPQDKLLIGTMDGSLFLNIKDESVNIFNAKDAITVIRTSMSEEPMIALGTTGGYLYVLDQNHNILLESHAHLPSSAPQDLRFGSMGKYAEIWSLVWSPDNSMIATCSEDQTTRIWNLDGEELACLKGHTTAVTSVEWKRVCAIDVGIESPGDIEILATCADDQTVMIWTVIDGNFSLHHIFDTKSLQEWHTLTYLTYIEPATIICGTQNGYIFAWDLKTKSETSGKYHQGSIEGLASHQETNQFATCSADCTIAVFTLENNQLK